jgi:hypothetical protein
VSGQKPPALDSPLALDRYRGALVHWSRGQMVTGTPMLARIAARQDCGRLTRARADSVKIAAGSAGIAVFPYG